MALVRPFDEWPLLICGPILRRVTANEIAVFAVTKVPCDVQLLVGVAGSNVPDWVNVPVRTRAMGRSLHVTVCHLTMPASEALQPGVVYEYDLRMTPLDTADTQTLAQQPGLLTGTEPLGYTLNALPTFSVPPALTELNLLHSSCRKPHGGGQDALKMVDQLIKRALADPSASERALRRPHHLLLTGDQIYADDVAIAMLSTLQEAGGLLCAQAPEETFPVAGPMTSPQVKPGTAREAFLKANTTLTSDHGMNHLMYFAEFCAMYVMCWSDELWPRGADGKLQLGATTVEPELRDQNDEERANLVDFLRTLRRARRALANVPTLMMFDDHEISDDWNLDGGWFDNSRDDPGQHRVVRNGLLAFAVFQAWGNEPARFDAGVPKDLLDVVSIPQPAGTAAPIVSSPAAVDVPLNLTAATGPRMTWSWTIDGREHRVIALDTRTVRDYTTLGSDEPGLLTAAELQRQLTANQPAANANLFCFVIAPAPVVGHPFVEQIVQPGVARIQDARAADNEAWCVNRVTYQAMLRRLADFGRVVVLSGDVHYGYTNHTAYFSGNGEPRGRIVQLCSSASKNTEIKTRLIQALGYLGSDGESWLGFADPLSRGTRLMLIATLLGPSILTTLGQIQHNLFSRIMIFKLFETPAVVPNGPWLSAPAFREVKRLADRRDPNDWRYKVSLVEDGRNGKERLAIAREIDPRPHAFWALHVIKHAHKAVVGEPNVGQVLVRTQAGRLVVQHRLHWMTSADPTSGAQTCTLHIAPLHPPEPAELPEPFI